MRRLCRDLVGCCSAFSRVQLLGLLFVFLFQGVGLANPSGEKVISGAATFQRSGDVLTITQGTDKAVVDWQDFSIAEGETTSFLQPSAMSAILNRVVTDQPSQLFGHLLADGQVYLVNQNGILVGESGVVDTNGFVASTLDISSKAFMAGGDLTFLGDSSAGILNLGTIRALDGDVLLISRDVKNAGVISASAGTAALVGGSEVLLKASGDEKVFIQASSSSGSVENSGLVDAASAELKARGGNEYALAVNNEGVVRAAARQERGGRVWLVADIGTVESSGDLIARAETQGGDVQILGDHVHLLGDATIDVTGITGGGTVLVGGDFQGNNPAIKNAVETFVGSDVCIDASATG
ncbi:MAG: hypothetical protein C0618_11895 [Desulfuromonas sp.]|nr:MAG: hypothetical protein C0618_11895 [Desulfuromonas sp.]